MTIKTTTASTAKGRRRIHMTTPCPPKNADKRRLWFKHQLENAGSNYQAIADMVGLTRQRVRQSILNPPPHIAEAVAQVLGKDKRTLWPHRYSDSVYSINHG